jgi:hypothetical protein
MIAARRLSRTSSGSEQIPSLKLVFGSFRNIFLSLRTPGILRWLVLLEFSDLMLDVFYGFLALYFVDVAGFTNTSAVLAVPVWTGVGLLGITSDPNFWIVRDYYLISVIVVLFVFPAFLLVSQPHQTDPVYLLGLLNSGLCDYGPTFFSHARKSGSVLCWIISPDFLAGCFHSGSGWPPRLMGWVLPSGSCSCTDIGLPRTYSAKIRFFRDIVDASFIHFIFIFHSAFIVVCTVI